MLLTSKGVEVITFYFMSSLIIVATIPVLGWKLLKYFIAVGVGTHLGFLR